MDFIHLVQRISEINECFYERTLLLIRLFRQFVVLVFILQILIQTHWRYSSARDYIGQNGLVEVSRVWLYVMELYDAERHGRHSQPEVWNEEISLHIIHPAHLGKLILTNIYT